MYFEASLRSIGSEQDSWIPVKLRGSISVLYTYMRIRINNHTTIGHERESYPRHLTVRLA